MQVVKLYMQVVILACQVLTNARYLNEESQSVAAERLAVFRPVSNGHGAVICKQVGGCARDKMDFTRRGVLQTTNLLAAGTMSLGEAALAGLAESPFSIQSTQVKRVRFKNRRSFDEGSCCSPNSITTSGSGYMVSNGNLRGGYLAIRSSQ